MNNIKLSIIIPVYNLENHIAMTLDSCLNQDIPSTEYEILCIDDGSKDNSLAILQEYEKSNINVHVYTKENGGVSSARNMGINLAKGKYIWFVDGDDLIATNCLAKPLDAVMEYDADVFNFMHCHATVREHFIADTNSPFETCGEGPEKLEFLTFNGVRWLNAVWQYWFKKDFLIGSNLFFNEKSHYGEDAIFLFLATMNAKKCMRSKMVLYLYYRHPGSIVANINGAKRRFYIENCIESAHYLDTKIKNADPFWKKNGKIKINYFSHGAACALVKEGDVAFAKEKIKQMKEYRLYPYPMMWATLKVKGVKQKFVSFLRLLLKFKCILMLAVRISARKKKKK